MIIRWRRDASNASYDFYNSTVRPNSGLSCDTKPLAIIPATTRMCGLILKGVMMVHMVVRMVAIVNVTLKP